METNRICQRREMSILQLLSEIIWLFLEVSVMEIEPMTCLDFILLHLNGRKLFHHLLFILVLELDLVLFLSVATCIYSEGKMMKVKLWTTFGNWTWQLSNGIRSKKQRRKINQLHVQDILLKFMASIWLFMVVFSKYAKNLMTCTS